MKKVTVLTFGAITDIIGENSLEIKDVETTNNLIHILEEKYPALKAIKYALAVDKKVVHNDVALHDNATVAILPPFSGG